MATALLAASGLCSPSVYTQSSALSGNRTNLKNVDCGHSRVVCKKEGIHPPFFPEAKVYCNGELVMTTGGTKEEYVVDVWSGNHPFYLGNGQTLVKEAGRVDKFNKRFGSMLNLSTIPVLTKGEIIIPKKGGKKAKGKK